MTVASVARVTVQQLSESSMLTAETGHMEEREAGEMELTLDSCISEIGTICARSPQGPCMVQMSPQLT